MPYAPRQVLRWANPPPPRANAEPLVRRPKSSQWDAVASQLKGEAGTYAVIFEGTYAQACGILTAVNGAKLKCFEPAGAFRATMRGTTEVYAKYVGGKR
jgi:hypothetical protein